MAEKRSERLKRLKEEKRAMQTGGVDSVAHSTAGQSSILEPHIPAADIGTNRVNNATSRNMKVLNIDPARCRPWKYHNRKSTWLSEVNLASLIESIKIDDQQQFGLVRKIDDDPNYDYEIIFGLRRCAACGFAGKKFQARFTDASDDECFRLMHIENEESDNVSPLEKALSYSNALKEGVYADEEDLMRRLDIHPRHYRRVRRIGAIADFPSVFEFVNRYLPDLSFRRGEDIVKALSGLPENVQLGGVVHELESVIDRRDGDSDESPIDLLVSVLNKAGKSTKSSKPEATKKTYLPIGTRHMVSLVKNSRGDCTIKVDRRAVNHDELKLAFEEILNDMKG